MPPTSRDSLIAAARRCKQLKVVQLGHTYLSVSRSFIHPLGQLPAFLFLFPRWIIFVESYFHQLAYPRFYERAYARDEIPLTRPTFPRVKLNWVFEAIGE